MQNTVQPSLQTQPTTPRHRSGSAGFTVIELLTTLLMMAVLVRLAAPSFAAAVRANSMSSAVNAFLTDMRYARSEAVRRGSMVVMCRADAPESPTPSCGSGSGPGGNGWISGWIIFVDRDNSQSYNAGDQLLRVQASVRNINSIVESNSTKFMFVPTGRLRNLGSATQLQFGSSPDFPNDKQRVVCVDAAGRARIAGDGYASCPSSDN